MDGLRQVGRSAVRVPAIGFGTSGLGDMPGTYGYGVDEERACATVRAVLARPDGFLESSRIYGFGRSEARIGAVVRELGGWPAGRVLSTKLDRDPETGRLDAARARRSLEESLAALGRDRVEILHLHDPERTVDGKVDGALDALMRMREEGLAGAVGLAAGRVDVMLPLLRAWDFDALITHNRWTLVNRNAAPLLALAAERGISVMNAAPYAGGALAKGAAFGRYVYQEAGDEVLAPVRAVEAIAVRHGVPPGAIALQFSLRDRAVAATICGVTRPERVQETLEWAAWPIPPAVWDELSTVPVSTNDPESTRAYRAE